MPAPEEIYGPAVVAIGEGRTLSTRRRLLVEAALAAAGIPERHRLRGAAVADILALIPRDSFDLGGYGEIANRLAAATSAARRAVGGS